MILGDIHAPQWMNPISFVETFPQTIPAARFQVLSKISQHRYVAQYALQTVMVPRGGILIW